MAPRCHVHSPRVDELYKQLGLLSQGSFSTVVKALSLETGKLVALKHRSTEGDAGAESGILARLQRELAALGAVEHPNVVALRQVYFNTPSEGSCMLIFDYVAQDLRGVLREHGKTGELMPFETVRRLSHQLLCGLDACHARKVMHRDLRPANILVGSEGAKICGFGAALGANQHSELCADEVESLWYRAPELLWGCKDYGLAADLWSAGCILGEMAIGMALFPGASKAQTAMRIALLLGAPPPLGALPEPGPVTLPPLEPTRLRPLLVMRPELGGGGITLLRRLLRYSQQARPTARRARDHAFFVPPPRGLGLGSPVQAPPALACSS